MSKTDEAHDEVGTEALVLEAADVLDEYGKLARVGRCLHRHSAKTAGWVIFTPIVTYEGETGGVHFVEGCAFVANKDRLVARDLTDDFGYTAEFLTELEVQWFQSQTWPPAPPVEDTEKQWTKMAKEGSSIPIYREG